MVEFPYKSSTEVPKHHSKHIPAASVANASGSLQTPLSELTRRSDFHLFYRDYCAASLPIECWSFTASGAISEPVRDTTGAVNGASESSVNPWRQGRSDLLETAFRAVSA